MRITKKSALIISALLASTGISAAAEEITIGVIGPLSGPAANTGVAARQAIELAVKEWNDGKGPSETATPPKVKVIFEDAQSRPEVGVSAVNKLFTRDNVDLILGDTLNSSVALAVMDLAEPFNRAVVSVEPVSTEIAKKIVSNPEKYRNVWKGNYNSDGYGNAVHGFYSWMIEQGHLKPKNKTIAYVIEDTDYGKSNEEIISQLFAKDGWTTTTIEAVPPGHADFYPQLSKLRQNPPDIVVSVFTNASSGLAYVRQFQEQGIEASSMGIYYPTKPEFMEQVGQTGEGMVWASLQYAPELYDTHKKFDDAIRAEYNVGATYSHAQDYCVTNIVLRALEAAGSADADKVSAELAKTDYNCIIGRYIFGDDDHTIKHGPDFLPVPVAQIQDGKNVVLWPPVAKTGDFKE